MSGSKTTKTEVPEWLESAARQNLAGAGDVASLGYVPYMGPDVAALTPMQEAAMQNTSAAASAFGMPGGGMTGMEGMPQAQEFAGGLRGYSSAPMYQQSLDQLREQNPGQYEAMMSMFINPQTGAGPTNAAFGQAPAQAAMPQVSTGRSDGSDASQAFAGSGGLLNSRQGPSGGGFNVGGYTSVRDMFDGGGAGTSGDTFSGGPSLSGIANRLRGNR